MKPTSIGTVTANETPANTTPAIRPPAQRANACTPFNCTFCSYSNTSTNMASISYTHCTTCYYFTSNFWLKIQFSFCCITWATYFTNVIPIKKFMIIIILYIHNGPGYNMRHKKQFSLVWSIHTFHYGKTNHLLLEWGQKFFSMIKSGSWVL